MVRAPEALYVARTVQALELLALQELSARQVAAALQVDERTARRLLRRLQQEGWVTRTRDSRRLYAPTMRIVAVAGQVVDHARLTRTAVPFVARLHEQTGTAAHLCVPSYRSVLCLVHRADGAGPARPQLRELVPCHCTAAGKALLGWRAPWRESVLSRPLEGFTGRTVTDPDRVRAELARVRERGYALERGEFQDGLHAVAGPVFAADGEAVAALGVSAPIGVALGAATARVVAMAAELSQALASGDA
jgi:IclR family transcriptional regulator, acetate operon repressor